jgi:gamma-glutamylcyclotransferase (GGCT)/AIG2-like uncharacterized protein YtfP
MNVKKKKSNLILGIAIALLGGAIMVESMISAISLFAGNAYEDFQVLNIEHQERQAPLKSSFFSIEEGQLLSVWLRYSNRRMKNTAFKLDVYLVDEDANRVKKFRGDFRFGRFHNSAKKVRFYKLGEHRFKNEFRGYLQYVLDGTWTRAKTGALVLRKSQPLYFPLKQIGFFVAGLFALFVGIETLKKFYEAQMMHLFAYGTLMCEDIMREVAGCRLSNGPGTVKGYGRRCVKGEHYPALVPEADSCVDGMVYRDVPKPAWERLDKFEGGMYARRHVRIEMGDGMTLSAQAYVVKPEFMDRLEETEWEFSEFLRSGKAQFQRLYKGYRSL